VVADVMAIFLGTVDDLCIKKVIWQEWWMIRTKF
jgi:hypothetical protein